MFTTNETVLIIRKLFITENIFGVYDAYDYTWYKFDSSKVILFETLRLYKSYLDYDAPYNFKQNSDRQYKRTLVHELRQKCKTPHCVKFVH